MKFGHDPKLNDCEVLDAYRQRRIAGKFYKEWPNGDVSIDDATGVRHTVSADRVLSMPRNPHTDHMRQPGDLF